MTLTAFDLAMRFVGTKEVSGVSSHPLIAAMLSLDGGETTDEIPWCSAYVNFIAWLLRLPRSKSLAARSWLGVGTPIHLDQARPGFDVVILTRAGATKDPGVLNAPGHVGWYAGANGNTVMVLGGNQSNSVSLARFPTTDVLGVRRLA
jgi:uncharacterized protein (TIGR02594 family)